MSGPITLDDGFVDRKLRRVARYRALDPAAVEGVVSSRINGKIDDCLDLFDRHRGIPPTGKGVISKEYRTERRLLNYALHIVGHVLNLESAIPVFERVIETDWKAHVELRKQKRYRDHITHPVRVTAIGWWLLHRKDGALLADLAAHYERETQGYRGAFGIDPGPYTWEAIVEYAWLACGLLHDSAYPLEYHLRAGEDICEGFTDTLRIFTPTRSRFSTARGRQAFLKPLDDTWFAGQGLDLDGRLSELCKEGRFKHAHAILGPLHHLLAFGDSRRHLLQGLVVQLAARAIVSHHDDEDGLIVADPLSLLLCVADSLQAWKRPFLHREEAAYPATETHKIRPIVECERIGLTPGPTGYLAKFHMNNGDRAILKSSPYDWAFDQFCEPNRRVERLLRRHPKLPAITLSAPCCIQPEEFLTFMNGATASAP